MTQKQLPKIVRNLKSESIVSITVRDHTDAFLVSPERMKAIAETLDILGNQLAVDTIKDYKSKKLNMFSLDDV